MTARARLFAADTRVPVAQSRAEIERLLSNHKAQQFGTAVDYINLVARVQFMLHNRIVRFSIALPDPNRHRGARLDQATRQRWRALLLVIKAKLEAVQNNITTFEQEFLAHIVMPNDQTVAEILIPQISEIYSSGQMKALGPKANE